MTDLATNVLYHGDNLDILRRYLPKYRGYYYVSADGGLASQQPTVVTGAAQVNFWLGMFPPSQAVLDAYLATLGTNSKRLFPLSFKGDLPAVGHKSSGVIPSFRKWSGKPDGEAVR
jgi:hypothetical protein